MAKITVDQEACIGCGACVSICPDVFEMDSNAKSRAKVAESDAPCVQQAADTCPVDAIKLE